MMVVCVRVAGIQTARVSFCEDVEFVPCAPSVVAVHFLKQT